MQRDYLSEYNFTGGPAKDPAKVAAQKALEKREGKLWSGLSDYGYALRIGQNTYHPDCRGYEISERRTGKVVSGRFYSDSITEVENFLEGLKKKGRMDQMAKIEDDQFLDAPIPDAMIHELGRKYGTDLLIGATYRQAFDTAGKKLAGISETWRFLYGLYEAAEG